MLLSETMIQSHVFDSTTTCKPNSLSRELKTMVQVIPTDQPNVAPLKMPDRFRKEIVYFMSPAEGEGAPKLGKNEYWIRANDAAKWLDDGFFSLVSPLDAESVAEIELSEDQEIWLEWMVQHNICTVKIA